MEQPLIEKKSPSKEAKKAKNPDSNNNKRIIRKLVCVSILALIFMGAEVAGGIIAGSIAILSDAAHMLSDLLGFAISIISIYISGLPATKKYSFGYHRAGVIGAMTSVLVIWILSGFLIYFAIQRIIHIDEVEVEGFVMFGVSCFGLVTNIIMVLILHGGEEGHSHGHGACQGQGHGHSHGKGGHKHGDHSHDGHSHSHSDKKHPKHDHKENHSHDADSQCAHQEHAHQVAIPAETEQNEKPPRERSGRHSIYIFGSELNQSQQQQSIKQDDDKENLNVRATMIHILGDILQSIGVIISSALIWQWPEKFKIADPIITLLFAFIVLVTTLKIVGTCIYILMEGTPKEVDHEELEKKLREVDGVVELHDIHIWSLNIKKNALAMHARIKGDPDLTILKMKKICKKYEVLHTTIQIEMVKGDEEKSFDGCKQDIHLLIEHEKV